jgi:uncharacterized protein DUF5694
MKRKLAFYQLLTSLLVASTTACATEAAENTSQALMLGMFHFSNPGTDVVKVDQVINVLSDESQTYLTELSSRIISNFAPTIVLLEYGPENDALIQGRYKEYLNGTYELGTNEVYQLGFRIAKMAGGIPVEGFDERTIGWDAEPLFEVMPAIAPEVKARMDQLYADITAETEEENRTLSLRQKLQKLNTEEADKRNMNLYLMTNVVGAGSNFEGATAASSWWHRNFRMYANIQHYANPGERILVIGGQGHTAILKSFLAIDSEIEGVDIASLL